MTFEERAQKFRTDDDLSLPSSSSARKIYLRKQNRGNVWKATCKRKSWARFTRNHPFIVSISFTRAIVEIHLKTRERLKACLHAGGGPQVGEVTCLSI